jgi:superfamily II DNA/RNA helicase
VKKISDTKMASTLSFCDPNLSVIDERVYGECQSGRDVVIHGWFREPSSTRAYLLPILQKINPHNPYCQALIMTGTEESARQVN